MKASEEEAVITKILEQKNKSQHHVVIDREQGGEVKVSFYDSVHKRLLSFSNSSSFFSRNLIISLSVIEGRTIIDIDQKNHHVFLEAIQISKTYEKKEVKTRKFLQKFYPEYLI